MNVRWSLQPDIKLTLRTISQSGWVWFTPRYSTKLANPSFNHKSFHHLGETMLPNHWEKEDKEVTKENNINKMHGKPNRPGVCEVFVQPKR